MFDNIIKFFKKFSKEEKKDSKETAKERLHLVLMQDRANVSADFMELMKQEIIEVIKKYIDVDENSIDVKLTNKVNTDGTTGAPMLYANIPILNVKDDTKQINIDRNLNTEVKEETESKQEINEEVSEKEEIVEKEEVSIEKVVEMQAEEQQEVQEEIKEEIKEEEKIVEEDSKEEKEPENSEIN